MILAEAAFMWYIMSLYVWYAVQSVPCSSFSVWDKREEKKHSQNSTTPQPTLCLLWPACVFPWIAHGVLVAIRSPGASLGVSAWGGWGEEGKEPTVSTVRQYQEAFCVCWCLTQRSSSAVCSSGLSLHSQKTRHLAVAHALSFSFFPFHWGITSCKCMYSH